MISDSALELIEEKANEVAASGTYEWPSLAPDNFISLVRPSEIVGLVARLRAAEAGVVVYRTALEEIATVGPTFATTFKRGSGRGNSLRECRRIAAKALAS